MIRKITPAVVALLLASGLVAQSAQDVELAREEIQKWVETRQVISKERSEWKVQKESLLSTKELLQQELEGLIEDLDKLEGGESAADSARAELTEEKQNLTAATDSVKQKVADLEVKIKEVVKTFPEALKTQVDPLVRRIPENPYQPGRLSVGERLPNIVGIIQTANKYNSSIYFYNETVEHDGRKIQVDILYWGLAIAYFVDQQNTYAGYKYPTNDGWETVEMSEAAAEIRSLVDMYQGKDQNIRFNRVPAAIN